MFWKNDENNVNIESNEENENKKKKYSAIGTMKEMTNMLFKDRKFKIEPHKLQKEDKLAALITAIIIIGGGALLWFLPFTHDFIYNLFTGKL